MTIINTLLILLILSESGNVPVDITTELANSFRKTKAMKAFLDERQRRQIGSRGKDSQIIPRLQASGGSDQGLKSLIESVKRKSQGGHGNVMIGDSLCNTSGKRRRV